ncbi:MAG TPA: EamA family transporter [Verrucomicrobiae bacterium]|nr:EamA family transporter [Verrucomicrobiae bacterium]
MSNVLAYLALCFIWGSTWLAIKIGLADFPPFLFAGIRCLTAAAILWMIMKLRGEKIPLVWQQLRGPVVFGLTNGWGLGLVFWGEQYLTSSLTATLNAILPFFSAIFAYFLVNEKFTLQKFLGLIVGFCGVLVIFIENISGFAGAKLLGELAVVVAGALYAWGGAYAKRCHNNLQEIPAVTIQQFFSAVALLPIGFSFERTAHLQVTWPAVGAFLWLVIVGSVIAFILYYNLLLKIEFTRLSYISMITPIVATFIGVVWGNEQVKLQYILGLGIICLGMVLVNWKFGTKVKAVEGRA